MTYRELLNQLLKLDEKQLEQKAAVFIPSLKDVSSLHGYYGDTTMEISQLQTDSTIFLDDRPVLHI